MRPPLPVIHGLKLCRGFEHIICTLFLATLDFQQHFLECTWWSANCFLFTYIRSDYSHLPIVNPSAGNEFQDLLIVSSCTSDLMTLIYQLSNPQFEMIFNNNFRELSSNFCLRPQLWLAGPRVNVFSGYIPFGAFALDFNRLYSLMDSVYSLIN